MQSRPVLGVLFALLCACSTSITACLSSSSSDGPRQAHDAGGSPDAGTLPSTTGGNVGADGGDASLAQVGAGSGIVSGGVRASSSAHVLVTSTGQAPGGNGAMHSAAHTVVGGVVGATQ